MFESVFTLVAKLRGGASDDQTSRTVRRPTSTEERLALARELTTAGEPLRAAHHYSEVVAREPTNAEAHREYAALLAEQSYVESAAAHYERALELTADEEVREEYDDLLAQKGERHKLSVDATPAAVGAH